MSEGTSTGPPAFVTKRDGRVEPFDADEICQSLFAATEALGAPNAFLARELTDAVMHFLAADPGDTPPATAQLADRIVRVVRELGQPALAQAFARRAPAVPPDDSKPAAPVIAVDVTEPPTTFARRCLRSYSERAIFSRDLVAAQADGLLLLAGLETPRALACTVLDVTRGATANHDPWLRLAAQLAAAGQGLVLDGPEWHTNDALLDGRDRDWLLRLPALVGRHLVVNLNAAQPPGWAGQRGGGPLFADAAIPDEPALDSWLDALRPLPQVRWDWHLQARDFAAGPARDRLAEVVRRALDGSHVAFVFDRPRRPVALAEGMDRQRPAVLLEVGLDLGAFLRLPSVGGNADTFSDKLPSLARMAVSAGAQKRKYLRRHTDFGGFLLDRARLAVVPLGLNGVVRALTGHGIGFERGDSGLSVGRQIVQHLDEHLRAAARDVSLEACLDSPGPGLTELLPLPDRLAAGLSCADATLDPADQLRAAGVLHGIAGQGTARVLLPRDREPAVAELGELLQFAWRRTEVVRVVFQRGTAEHTQASLEL